MSQRRIRRGGRGGPRALVALGSALSIHAVVMVLVRFVGPSLLNETPMPATTAATTATDDQPLELSSLVESLDRPDAPTRDEKEREEAKKKEEANKDLKGQVVDIAKPAIEVHPDDAKYLAEYDSKVDHEQKGPHGRDKAGAAAQVPAPESRAQAQARGGRVGESGRAQSTPSPQASSGHDGMPVADDGEMQKPTGPGRDRGERVAVRSPVSVRPPEQAGEQGERGDGKTAGQESAATPPPNLTASPEMLQRAIGAGKGSMDYLKNLDDGDATALNAKKYMFALFFNRVKAAVAQEWHPDTIYLRHDPSGNVYGVKDRVTVLRVHVMPDGALASTDLLSSSGIDFLDDEAVQAFKKAQPFPNPPKGLVEADGQIHFTFGFIFELSGRTSVKVYKYK